MAGFNSLFRDNYFNACQILVVVRMPWANIPVGGVVSAVNTLSIADSDISTTLLCPTLPYYHYAPPSLLSLCPTLPYYHYAPLSPTIIMPHSSLLPLCPTLPYSRYAPLSPTIVMPHSPLLPLCPTLPYYRFDTVFICNSERVIHLFTEN